jgi:spermidine/putrescine transport system substrate-binding protein
VRILAPEGHTFSRRDLMKFGAASVSVGILGAPHSQFMLSHSSNLNALQAAAKRSLKAVGKFNKSLYIYTWGQYDNPTTFSAFQSATGIQLQFGSYSSNEAMIAKLELAQGTAGYDIVVPTGGYVPEMVAKGLLLPLNKKKLPNFAKVDSKLLNFPWDHGNKYTVPKDYGTTGFIYDKTVITRKMTTWSDFAKAAALPGVSGKVSLLDDPNDVMGIALWNAGIDWNTPHPAQLRTANKWMIKYLAPHVSNFDSYPGGTGGLVNGSYVLSEAWNGDARQAIEHEPHRFAWVVPEPASEIWVDNWAIAKGAKDLSTAHALIDYVIDPVVAANELTFTGYASPVNGVKDFLPTRLPAESMIFLTAEQSKRLTSYVVNSSNNLRTQLYSEFKAATATG